jgi:hypothetical protein
MDEVGGIGVGSAHSIGFLIAIGLVEDARSVPLIARPDRRVLIRPERRVLRRRQAVSYHQRLLLRDKSLLYPGRWLFVCGQSVEQIVPADQVADQIKGTSNWS